MSKRKTISIKELAESVNSMCRNSHADAKDIRQGAINVLTDAMHKTGSYKGFRYLLVDEIHSGDPGINFVNGLPHPNLALRFSGTDCTRVHFFTE